MRILVFDPSGNYFEGKGTTGWALYYNGQLTSIGQIRAIETDSQIIYWKEHLTLIEALKPDVLVVEEYILFASAKKAQIGSSFETIQLIGILKYYCDLNNIKIVAQPALIKNRYTNEILIHKGIITQDAQKHYYALGIQTTRHILDAIRHGEYYLQFNKKKKVKL
jgi:hypothetical protein